jgi:hypothetical protein
LLSIGALCWVTAVALIAGQDAHWSDGAVTGLLVAGGFCFASFVFLLGVTPRVPRSPKSVTHAYAERFLREEGLWPSWRQRLLHPRTPVRDLAIHVPQDVKDQFLVEQDALQAFIDELRSNRRLLELELEQKQVFRQLLAGDAWAKNRDVLNAADIVWTRELVQDAYMRTHEINVKERARYDAARAADVNRREWKRLTTDETQERRDALTAVTAALAVVTQARSS